MRGADSSLGTGWGGGTVRAGAPGVGPRCPTSEIGREAQAQSSRRAGTVREARQQDDPAASHLRAQGAPSARNRAGRWPKGRKKRRRSLQGGLFALFMINAGCEFSVDSEFQSLK